MSRRTLDTTISDSLDLEGGLFVPAILERVSRGVHSAQSASDYRLPKGLSLVDEQGRSFRIASTLWKTYQPSDKRHDTDAARATISFVTEFLRDALGYNDFTAQSVPIEVSGRGYPITAMTSGGRVPVVIAPFWLDIDTPDERFAIVGSGSRRRSAYQLAQQFLDASAECTWALITNGRQLRLIRDADTLTRPAFLEADLEQILKDKPLYSEFAAVWRIFHASRAGESKTPPESCIWETWKHEGLEQGERVREGLREGVTKALLTLGAGFLEHPANAVLRERLQSGGSKGLSADDYFQQLLRLVYRFLFLFTVEERKSLHVADDSSAARQAREIYAQGYAMHRLRNRSIRRSGFDRNGDIWIGIGIVFRGLAQGEPQLALPALGGIFATSQCPDLDAAKLDNRAILGAMRNLRWAEINRKLAPVDYGNMGPEELGSVYESLLELIPVVNLQAETSQRFGFAGSTDGNARKTSGSYYTPDTLVQKLLGSALDPVIEQRLSDGKQDPVKALLDIAVIDPACGSGHFLLAAARRLAEKLAEQRSMDGAVTPADYRHALREVIAHCIYGVDRNPMAVELARIALWLEGYEPGRPLSFLDHHLLCGDSLLGLADYNQLLKGIPQDAFASLSGDSKPIAKQLALANRIALKNLAKRTEGVDMFAHESFGDLLGEIAILDALPETTTKEVEAKASAYTAFLDKAKSSRLSQAADLYIAAFLSPKAGPNDAANCPTTQTLLDLMYPRDGNTVPPELIARAHELCSDARVLHWPIAFPTRLFTHRGFDCVLGNPPWERIKLQEKEFFAAKHTEIANAQNKATRDKLIELLATSNPADQQLYHDFITSRRTAEAMSVFAHIVGEEGGRFALTGVGDVNTYALFAETILSIAGRHGRAGFIVPTGIATDDSTKAFFAYLAEHRSLVSLYDFENREGIFPGVHRSFKFCLMTLGPSEKTDFAFFLTQTNQLDDIRRHFTLSGEDFALINPNTRTCPIFRSQADAELTKKIYRRAPVLIEESRGEMPEQNPWGISFSTMFHMSNNSGLFLNSPESGSLPLYEAKMMHQFDHRWATYVRGDEANEPEPVNVTPEQKADQNFQVTPRYWVREYDVFSRLAAVPCCVSRAFAADEFRKEGETMAQVKELLLAKSHELLVAFANWIESARQSNILSNFSAETPRQHVVSIGGKLFEALPAKDKEWQDSKAIEESVNHQPLSEEELDVLRSSPTILNAARKIMDARSPRWLMGWRDITNATNERTVIASVIPRRGAGDTLLLMFPHLANKRLYACLLADQNSLPHDYTARQKVGGTHIKYNIKKQLPILAPNFYTESDVAFIVPRVLELTYTSADLKAWAADLGYTNISPFRFDPDRRAVVRAELDAYYAKLYGLTREELCYILDPAEVKGADYPTETFRGLKNNDIKDFGEYRTQRLVLEAWDEQHAAEAVTAKTNWKDQSFVLLAPQRINDIAETIYRTLVVRELMLQSDNKRLDFEVFQRAYWLLTEPIELKNEGEAALTSIPKTWWKNRTDKLKKEDFISYLEGALNIHSIRLFKANGKRFIEWIGAVEGNPYPQTVDDARVAISVSELMNSDAKLVQWTFDNQALDRMFA